MKQLRVKQDTESVKIVLIKRSLYDRKGISIKGPCIDPLDILKRPAAETEIHPSISAAASCSTYTKSKSMAIGVTGQLKEYLYII